MNTFDRKDIYIYKINVYTGETMSFKYVNKYGQNWSGQTFKTQAKAKAWIHYQRTKMGVAAKGAKLVKTKPRK